MASNDLLPCPFCGGEAFHDSSSDCTGTPMVGCMDCSAHVVARTPVEAGNAWNCRALPAALPPEAKWTGVGGDIAPKFDPNCECVCHSQPGVMHVAPCCQPHPEAEPVAQTSSAVENLIALIGQYGLFMGETWRVGEGAEIMDAYQAAYDEFTAPAPVVPAEGLDALIEAAKAEAEKAMSKFPQPNYVISKVAEEAGEVVKAAIHCAEGRETQENVVSEIRQAMAMLFRLYLEGDQVHGLPPLRARKWGI